MISSKGVEWRVDRVRDRANAHHCTYSTEASVGQHVLGKDERRLNHKSSII